MNSNNKTNNMSTFYERLFDEKKQLDERKEKLDLFLESGKASEIDRTQSALLKIQLRIMEAYSQILGQRIDLLNDSNADT